MLYLWSYSIMLSISLRSSPILVFSLVYLFVASSTHPWKQALTPTRVEHELNNIQQRDMWVTNYTLKIKELCNSLVLINVNIENDEMVQICVGGLAPWFGTIKVSILARENPLDPPFSTFNQFYSSKKIMSDQGAMRQMVKCSTPSQTRKEDWVKETEVDWDEVGKVNRPKNMSHTIRLGTHQGGSIEGEPSCWTKSLKQHDQMQVLWKAWSLRRRVSKEDTRVGVDQPTTHKLCDELWLWRPSWNVRNEA